MVDNKRPLSAPAPAKAPAKKPTAAITRRVPLGRRAPTGRPKVSKPTGGAFEPIEDSFIEARIDRVGAACRSMLEMARYQNSYLNR